MSDTEGAAAERPMRRVRPWIAALLSLLISPGLGQFYARRAGRAFAWLAVEAVLLAVFLIAAHVFEDRGWLAFLFVAPVVRVVQSVDAFIVASAARTVVRGSPFRLLGYLGVYAVAVAIGGASILTIELRLMSIRTFYIPSTSMAPTLVLEDRVLVRMVTPFCPVIAVDRGDIVLVEGQGNQAGNQLVRRVVALAGDRVRIDDRGLEVNGERVTGAILGSVESDFRGRRVTYDFAEERFGQAQAWTVYANSPGDWGEAYEGVIPEGHVFSLGDNRANSNDDRFQGPTPIDAIIGRALRVPFSLAENSGPFWRNLRVRAGASCASS